MSNTGRPQLSNSPQLSVLDHGDYCFMSAVPLVKTRISSFDIWLLTSRLKRQVCVELAPHEKISAVHGEKTLVCVSCICSGTCWYGPTVSDRQSEQRAALRRRLLCARGGSGLGTPQRMLCRPKEAPASCTPEETRSNEDPLRIFSYEPKTVQICTYMRRVRNHELRQ